LDGCANGVAGVCVGHGLHADWRIAANGDHVIAPTHTRLQRTLALRLGKRYGLLHALILP
jgi:hypothetical protein